MDINRTLLEDSLRNINSTIKGRKLYPNGHPSVSQAIEKGCHYLNELLKTRDPLILGIVEDVLVFGDHSFIDSHYDGVMEQLKVKGVESLVFRNGLTMEEFSNFADLALSENSLGVETLKNELAKRSVIHITLKALPKSERFLEVYFNAVETVKQTMNEIRLGQIPKTGLVVEVVHDMTGLILEDKNAMIGLTMIKDYDNYLFTHSVNVSILAVSLGEKMGYGEFHLHQIGLAGLLHDVGKTGVAENIIKKPGKLNEKEFSQVREHPSLGYEIVSKMEDIGELTPRLVLEHHIGYNKKGYPKTTSWEDLHPFSMMVTIADTYDAMTTLRVYQQPREPVTAIGKMQSLAGKLLDPKYLDEFTKMLGTYPVGTLVRLNNNEVGLVIKSNPKDNLLPIVKVLFDNEGNKLENHYEVVLSESQSKGNNRLRIVSSVDPLSKNLDITDYFKGESKL
jgi:HD-GYP domain-containing protein (c-di-GMP phosphodiesterase class II)